MANNVSKTLRQVGLVLMIGGLCIFVHPLQASATLPVSSSGTVLSSPEQCMLTNNLNNCPGAAVIVADDDDDDDDDGIDIGGGIHIDL